MTELFKRLAEAVENTRASASCATSSFELGKPTCRSSRCPRQTPTATWPSWPAQGLHERFESCTAAAARSSTRTCTTSALELELGVIDEDGVLRLLPDRPGLHQLGQGSNGIPVGPGRGSGAGSLVGLRAAASPTSIRIPYNLLFERFLNPERVSMPDFDIDFCMDRRDEVIDYVREQVRQGQRRADRHLPPAQGAQRACATWPRDGHPAAGRRPHRQAGARAGARARACRSPRRSSRSRGSRRCTTRGREVRELLDTRAALEGLNRHAGMHAAGVVISRGAALGARARASARARTATIVTQYAQGRRRGGRPGQVRLPRPEDADRHRDRGEADQPRARGQAARRRSTSTGIPLDDAERLRADLQRRHHRRVPARVERASASC